MEQVTIQATKPLFCRPGYERRGPDSDILSECKKYKKYFIVPSESKTIDLPNFLEEARSRVERSRVGQTPSCWERTFEILSSIFCRRSAAEKSIRAIANEKKQEFIKEKTNELDELIVRINTVLNQITGMGRLDDSFFMSMPMELLNEEGKRIKSSNPIYMPNKEKTQ